MKRRGQRILLRQLARFCDEDLATDCSGTTRLSKRSSHNGFTFSQLSIKHIQARKGKTVDTESCTSYHFKETFQKLAKNGQFTRTLSKHESRVALPAADTGAIAPTSILSVFIKDH